MHIFNWHKYSHCVLGSSALMAVHPFSFMPPSSEFVFRVVAGKASGDKRALTSFRDSYFSGTLKLGMTPLWHDTISLQVRPERNCCLGKSRLTEFSHGSQLALTSGWFLPGGGIGWREEGKRKEGCLKKAMKTDLSKVFPWQNQNQLSAFLLSEKQQRFLLPNWGRIFRTTVQHQSVPEECTQNRQLVHNLAISREEECGPVRAVALGNSKDMFWKHVSFSKEVTDNIVQKPGKGLFHCFHPGDTAQVYFVYFKPNLMWVHLQTSLPFNMITLTSSPWVLTQVLTPVPTPGHLGEASA